MMAAVTIAAPALMTTVHGTRDELHLGFRHLAVFIEISHFKSVKSMRCELGLVDHTVITGGAIEVTLASGFVLFAHALMHFFTAGIVEGARFIFREGAIAISVCRREVARRLGFGFGARDAAIAIGIKFGEAFLHEAFAIGAGSKTRAALRIGKGRTNGRRQDQSQKGCPFHLNVSV